MRRSTPFLALLLLGIALGSAGASTLSPGHPVWSDPRLDTQSLRASQSQPGARMSLRASTATVAKGFAAHGQRVLVVPVLYADSGAGPIATADLERLAFADGTEASLRGFWREVSSGRFVPSGIVTGWTRLPETEAFYSNVSDGTFRGNAGPRLLVRDALRAIGDRVDLHAFDDDGPDGVPGSGDDDGRIDLLVILHPGVGFEVDPVASGPAMLAHQGRIDLDPGRTHPDVAADGYALVSARGPLGVLVHEFGHLLGLDDLYDLDVSGSLEDQPARGGLGIWSLMAHGTWGGGGTQPSNLDAFSRRLLGWEDDPIEVLVPGQWILDSVQSQRNQSLRIHPQGDWGQESFLLENRRRRVGKVVDADLPGDGILVLRFDGSLPLNDFQVGYGLEVLEADAGHDLRDLRDNGTASDLFDGADAPDVLAGDTAPSTQSRLPSASRLAPRILIGPSDAQSGHTLEVRLSDAPDLRLLEAYFPVGSSDRKTWLSPGQELPWTLAFRSLSELEPATAELRLEVGLDPRLEITADDPIRLVRNGAWWVPASPVLVRSRLLQAEQVAPEVAFTLHVDGGAPTPLRIGVPIGFQPGMGDGDSYLWEPRVVTASADTTVFSLLIPEELPLAADSGWETTVRGLAGYSDNAELTLTSPWFAVPVKGELEFWSRHETEESDPGQAWDGGVLEVFAPGRGWQPLRPTGPDLVLVNPISDAATRGQVGFGGPATAWQPYTATLPDWDVPVRVRLRFASDATFHRGSWSIAGLGTRPEVATASLVVFRDPIGRWIVRATLRGDFSDLVSARFRARAPLSTEWVPISDLLQVRPDFLLLEEPVTIPAGATVLTIGLFAEPGDGEGPELQLGTVGFRAPGAELALRPRVSPGPAPLGLEIPAAGALRHIDIYDLRGRWVSAVEVLPQRTLVEWDGTDGTRGRVASGRYVAILREDPRARVSLVLLR